MSGDPLTDSWAIPHGKAVKQLWEGHKDLPTGDLLRSPGCAQLLWLPALSEHFPSMGLLMTELLTRVGQERLTICDKTLETKYINRRGQKLPQ